MKHEILIPDDYKGRLLHGNFSPYLKQKMTSYIKKLKSIDEFLIPAILYIAAWENDKTDIWYEYAGENFLEIFKCNLELLPEKFRKSVMDRKVYIKNENKVTIYTQDKNFFLKKRSSIRSELKDSGFNDAVYKIRLNNDTLWLKDQAFVLPFPEDNITISIGNLTNVTKEMEAEEARKKAEAKLAEKEQMFRTLFNQAYEPIIIMDLNGKILDCNEVCEKNFALSKRNIVNNFYYDFVTKDDAQRLKREIKSLCKEKSLSIETKIIDPYGKKILSEINAVRVDTDIPIVQAIIRDISHKKQLEEEKIKMSKFTLVSTMASGIAHDVNNILSIILGNLSLAAIEASKIKNDKIKEILKRIEKASDLLETLTKKFFIFSDFSSIFKKNIKIEKIFNPLKEKHSTNTDITLVLKDNIDELNVNHEKFSAVLDAILENAVECMKNQHTKQIHIEISKCIIGTNNNPLKITLKPGNYSKIKIQDSGCGIAEENISRVLDPYYSTKPLTSQKGTGLGLTNAYSLIKQHNGNLRISSMENKGTCVTIYIPE